MALYTINRNDSCSRVLLETNLTASIIPDLQGALKNEITQGAGEIVFDLQKVSMLDSSGIGLLIATLNSLSAQQGTVKVLNVSPDIFRLLESMHLAARLNVSSR